MALLYQQPRAATVRTDSPCKVAVLNRQDFMRLCGPLIDVLLADAKKYNPKK